MGALFAVEKQLADTFNSTHNTDYAFSDLIIAELAVIGSNFPADFQAYNTEITLLKDDLGVAVVYSRALLAKYVLLPEGYKFALPKTANGSLKQLIPYLAKSTGIDFTDRDFEEGQYTIDSTLTSLSFKTAATSLRWVPGQTFTVSLPGKYRLTDAGCELLPITLAVGPDQWVEEHTRLGQNNGSKLLPMVTSSNTDYTPIAHILRAIGCVTMGWANDNRLMTRIAGVLAALVAALRSVDGLDWTYNSTAAPYNLYYAYPAYNGPTKYAKGFSIGGGYFGVTPKDFCISLDGADLSYDNVLVLRLNTAYCSGLQDCNLFFHYNDSLKKGRVV